MKLCSGSVLTLSNCAPFVLKQKVYKFFLSAITDFIALILRCALFIRNENKNHYFLNLKISCSEIFSRIFILGIQNVSF